ncbi:glycosyltransferase family 4 protein [Escherichia coli]|uniref:glycosyltransferase family 4 protein n=1 Tax=Escherichia coli TaxID=562 RepID=UPI000944FF24|nr:glycosyltransferase family 4 protein [Escherichia coli]EFH3485520.1 glycosyltransferase [Escherichia coli]EFJ5530700.1 glycosyltransferase family 4 protein [Escherichia coli]EFN7668722.1 glycosyltransferase family 4 protein [Escherichia coli]EGD9983114.1 glycosyltransferase family 4 protein [Escherichia coli]EHN4692756.1 glycosyltransferase family 4 protein [Escherichia coli]
MLRVCFIIADVTWTGGIERVLSRLALSIPDDNIDLEILSLYRTYKDTYYTFPDNVKIKYLNDNYQYKGRPGSFTRLVQHLRTSIKLREFLNSCNYDIIVVHTFPLAFINFFTEKRSKWVVVEHVKYYYYNILLRRIRSFIYDKYDAIVLLTDKDVTHFKNANNNVYVIPNPLSFSQTKKANLNSVRIISVGRLEKQKGFDMLLKAFSYISYKYPEWQLDIFGKGNEEENLRKLISKLNLKNVNLMGTSKNIHQEYLSSAFYVMSSRYEGFPMVLLEAMASGLPCISFNCETGPADIIIDNENGFLIEHFDVVQLSKAMEKLIKDEYLRTKMGNAAFERADEFSLEKITLKWKELFKGLTHEK